MSIDAAMNQGNTPQNSSDCGETASSRSVGVGLESHSEANLDAATASPKRYDTVVIGGGITGLSALFQLKKNGVNAMLFEAGSSVGGKLGAKEIGGIDIEYGADAFLARVPFGVGLVEELGLSSDLIEPVSRAAQIYIDGSLQRLPQPHVFGVPLDPETVEQVLGKQAGDDLRADIARAELGERYQQDPTSLSAGEKAELEKMAPRSDDTVGSLVRRRMGNIIHENLVEPLLGSISAGNTDELSLEAGAPQLLHAATISPSLSQGLKQMSEKRKSDAPIFYTLKGGMDQLINALQSELSDQITCDHAAVSLVELESGFKQIEFANGETVEAASVVLAVPAPVSAALVADSFGTAAAALAAIPMISVTMAIMVYRKDAVPADSDLSGFLVPRGNGFITTACSYATNKWPHWGLRSTLVDQDSSGETAVLRVSVGRSGDQDSPNLSDEELSAKVIEELQTICGISEDPLLVQLARWPESFPQYQANHVAEMDVVDAELNTAGVFIAGMSHRGIGIPACIAQGRSVANEIAESLQK